MNGIFRVFVTAVLSIALSFATACTKSSSGGDDEGSGGDTGGDGTTFTPDCGVVIGGEIRNSVSTDQGIATQVTSVVGSNTVVVNLVNGPALVKLHAIEGVDDYRTGQAMDLLRSISSGRAYFYKATETCSVTVSGGGLGTSGQVIMENGTNLSEELIKAGLSGPIDVYGTCSESLIGPCYNALKENEAPEEPAGKVTDFIWKPESDGGYRPGDLVVLASPCNALIYANGVLLDEWGSYHEYCSFARGTKPGCSYGANVRVEVKDKSTGRPYAFPDGKLYFNIPNGCSRVEFQGQ